MSASNFHIASLMATDVTSFVDDWHVRVTWIGFMTLWVFWALIWTIRSFFIGQAAVVTAVPDETAAGDDPAETTAQKKKFGFVPTTVSAGSHFAAKFERAHNLVQDILFSLLCLLSMNTFARASTRAAMILTWFIVAWAFVFFFAELFIDNRYARFAYAFILFGMYLALGGLAFKQGFY
ncbi:hypothetical protein K501DRAFT_338355 [Backusella circina FSU 941]|nr:hypothetical protein K501DRAFT_338355 [Backusella circina FSU 941]